MLRVLVFCIILSWSGLSHYCTNKVEKWWRGVLLLLFNADKIGCMAEQRFPLVKGGHPEDIHGSSHLQRTKESKENTRPYKISMLQTPRSQNCYAQQELKNSDTVIQVLYFFVKGKGRCPRP